MAGDWIKLRNDLPRDSRMFRVARECGVPVAHAIGSCVMLWTTASDTTDDGLMPPGVEDADIDHMGLLPGLSKSLRTLGWLETDEPTGRLRLPNFARYIGSAKERAAARERQRDYRAGKAKPPPGCDVTPPSQNVTVTKRDCHIENENEIEKQKDEAEGIAWARESGWSGITDADRKAWASAYPACNIDRQLAAMGEWLVSNPEKAHKSRWRRFITNWLSRSQEKGGDMNGGGNGRQGSAGAYRGLAGRSRGPNPNGTAHDGGAAVGEVGESLGFG